MVYKFSYKWPSLAGLEKVIPVVWRALGMSASLQSSIRFRGLSSRKDYKVLWSCNPLFELQNVELEQNSRINFSSYSSCVGQECFPSFLVGSSSRVL